LDDQATKFVSGRVHQFTHLESIEVYTERENVNLVDVLTAMKTSEEKLPDEKDNKALQAYFQKVYPTLDFDRVYASDMKKMVKWFDVLERNKVEIKLTEQEEEPVAEAVAEEAPEAKKKTDRKEADKSDKKLKSTKEEEKKPSAKKEEESPKKTKAAKEKEPPKKAAKKAAKKEEPKKAAKKKK
jgi:outer membrane biosynthesis protein TonB